jgi:hypothetical protein
VSARALAFSLFGGAGVLALLVLAWLAVSGAAGGGIVLGLILLVVLAGPLAIGGAVVLSRQSAEQAAEARFASKRRVLDADRLFRREMAAELRQVARRPELPVSRLEAMAEDLERSTYDTAAWYDAVQLTDADAQTLQRYEDLVRDRLRALRDTPPGQVAADVRALEDALYQRRDLLLSGRRAPEAAPSQMLRAGTPDHGIDAIEHLSIGDAVTADGIDYLVEGIAAYFAEGQTWKLAHLVVASGSDPARWLYAGPAGLEVALLDEVSAAPEDLPEVGRGTATVEVTGQAGSARGVLVSFIRRASADRFAFDERWPDGAHHTYLGKPIRPSSIDVWPATVRTPS